ncbi:taste receptor type 2 member 20-like [Elephas maximus indicus]|uniref:taste receptor type 2 member 20-like n=1 Tax=Elephas maximus indicus TaxID=99487 RepID=UPI00211633EA|nr:taste receptor type 2 member 20-like [Elephas maximus indicus]
MLSLVQGIFSTIVLVEFILGQFANSFIALVNFIGWVKRHKISLVDGILTALAVSRIGLLCVILIHLWLLVCNPVLHKLDLRAILIAWMVTNHFSMCLATCLSMFYLLKIASFSSLIFLHLKWRVERAVLMILFGSLVFLGSELAMVNTNDRIWMSIYERNKTLKAELSGSISLPHLIAFTLANFIPFTTSLTSLLLLIFSMWKHLKKMQLNGKGSQDPSTKAHIKAMQTVISFLLLFAIYFLCLIISVWSSNEQKTVVLCQTIGMVYPSSHSFVLIFVNQKLKEVFLSVLRQLRERFWLKGRKLSTS